MRPTLNDFLRSDNLRRVSPAGAFYRYDTYGTSLAGAIIERITGKTFAESMRQEMFVPLGMQNTFVEADEDHLPRLAMGYERIDGKNEAQPYEVYLTTPASSIDATAADMGRLLEALTGDGSNHHGRLFSAMMAEAVRGRQYYPHPEFPGVTHGLHESYDVGGKFERPIRSIDHGGVMAGFRSLLTILPDYKLGVFVTTNTSGVSRRNELAAAVMRAIVDQLPPSPMRHPFTVPSPDSTRDLSEYEGVYSYGVFCHSCTPTEFAEGAWTPGPPVEIRVTDGALSIGDRAFTARESDVFVRDDGLQKVFFGRDDADAIQFFTYSTSNDAFERVG
ncbi:MAG: serine hydrolase domain-containing protein, partial [Verrucomicrobiota bacterium]